MVDQIQTDERKTYDGVQKIIDAMLEFDKDTRTRILKTVATFFGIDGPLQRQTSSDAHPQERGTRDPAFSTREELGPKDFLFQKKPKTDMERVACLAYYLTHYRNIAHFRTTDISKLNTEAAQIKFSNASNSVNNAAKSGFLVPAAKGLRQLSAPGEKFVDALPDHATAKKLMSEVRPRRRKKSSGKDSDSLGVRNKTKNNE